MISTARYTFHVRQSFRFGKEGSNKEVFNFLVSYLELSIALLLPDTTTKKTPNNSDSHRYLVYPVEKWTSGDDGK